VILPKVFIPIAEDTGLIGKMTDSLLEQAVRDAKHWPEDIAVSLNFSGRQISDSKLAPRILGILTKASFPPDRLMIDVTESAVVQRLEDAKSTLQELRNVGVRIALDDFGTGYSGLYHCASLSSIRSRSTVP
jgi:predicted signal transduction protein with EAL and GGDEF domain